MSASDSESSILARQIRTELSDAPPEGFRFSDHVVHQDSALERLAEQLQKEPLEVVDSALSEALRTERSGWTAVKLIELVERLGARGCADALIDVAKNPPEQGDRRKFLAGRACEVLLKLPLDRATRLRADGACQIPLQEIASFRLGSQRELKMHRPRKIEWALLVVLMGLALTGLAIALLLPAQ
jgi:hypothetical protein